MTTALKLIASGDQWLVKSVYDVITSVDKDRGSSFLHLKVNERNLDLDPRAGLAHESRNIGLNGGV